MEFKNLTPLPRSFYQPSAARVAPRLLGQILVRQTSRGSCAGIIVEAEAYLADDPACHGYRRQTPRNRSMYGPPGHAYVYFIYGNHYCFNAVCQPEGIAEAVLVRALQPLWGEVILRENRPVNRAPQLTNGPGKLCQAMGIDRRLDGLDLCDAAAPLYLAGHPQTARFRRQYGPMVITPRIGIAAAADLPLRFCLPGSEYVSRVRGRIEA